VEALYEKWIETALSPLNKSTILRISDRVLILGDHIKISKEGRRMPDIQIMHQESQNSGKGEYIEGHNYGHVSAVITNGAVSRSLPLITALQKSPPKEEGTRKPKSDTLVTQMVNLAGKAAKTMNEPAIVALDAYFSKASAFEAAEKIVAKNGERLIHIVTRGKINTVAYTIPIPPAVKKRGRPKIYGDKVALKDLFSSSSQFVKATLTLYGEKAEVEYLCVDLLWKPVKKLIRFVLVKSGRGMIILMSDDLTLHPEDCITAYACRYKIEPSFGEQKNDMGCFSYHFWSQALPKRKRWGKPDEQPETPDNKNIERARKAAEAFVCVSTIATGILTVIAFSHSHEVWKRYPGWIKTLRSTVPSVAIVRETIAQGFHSVLKHNSTWLMGFNFIVFLLRSSDFLYEDFGDDEDESA
jgi:hypothetical protein